jgi:hypothetical protein
MGIEHSPPGAVLAAEWTVLCASAPGLCVHSHHAHMWQGVPEQLLSWRVPRTVTTQSFTGHQAVQVENVHPMPSRTSVFRL